MYCIYCGQPRPLEAAFCPHCGRAIMAVEMPAGTAPTLLGGRIPLVPWRGGQVALGILLVLISIVPVTILAIGLGSLAREYEDALIVWTSSHLMGLAILAVVWILGLRRYGVTLSALGFRAPPDGAHQVDSGHTGRPGGQLGGHGNILRYSPFDPVRPTNAARNLRRNRLSPARRRLPLSKPWRPGPP